MHYNTLFQDINLKKVSGAGQSPSLDGDPSPLGREKPLPDPTPPPRRLRRVDRRAFGAPHLALLALGFMRPVFSMPIVWQL